MRLLDTVFFSLCALAASAASEAVSPSFVLNCSYTSTPVVWADAVESLGLSALFSARTVPIYTDTDGDGIPDEWELLYGLDPSTPDADADLDGDGLTNLEEYNAGTNPTVPEFFSRSAAFSPAFTADLSPVYDGPYQPVIPNEVWERSDRFRTDTVGISPDTDGDGMRDDWEIAHGLNPFVPDGHLDSDGDGRTTLEEYNSGTHPLVPDLWHLSFFKSASFVTDTLLPYEPSGLPLVEETYVIFTAGNVFVCDTGGLYYDWDGDGIPNWWEARFSDNKTGINAAADLDEDGWDNYSEFVAYTDPLKPACFFTIKTFTLPAAPAQPQSAPAASGTARLAEPQAQTTRITLGWDTASNRVYKIFATSDLSTWPAEPILILEGTGSYLTCTIDTDADASRFFRISVELQTP